MSEKFYRGRGNDGIALIAVLSFLGIMLILGIALVASMRTERMAAEASRNDVNARIFAKGCVYSALDDINSTMWNDSTNIRVSKSFAVIESTNGTDTLGANSGILDGEVTNWVHRIFLTSADPNYDARAIAAAPSTKWINVPDSVASPAGKGLLGRFAYVAFEGSGDYDANLIATSVRSNGTSVGEVSLLPEITDLAGFKLNRAEYQRFATLSEINQLNDGITTFGPEKAAIDATILNDLVPYSLCYDAGWWDWAHTNWVAPGAIMTNGAGAVNVPGDVNLWDANDAAAVFHDLLGVNAAQSGDMATNFMDYMDVDNVPLNPDSFTTEAVPMINEITVSSAMANDAVGTVTHTITLSIETWFPFKDNQRADTFTFRPPLANVSVPGGPAILFLAPAQPLAIPPAASDTAPSAGPVPANISATAGYTNTTFTYKVQFQDSPPYDKTVQFGFAAQDIELQDSANNLIDRVKLGILGAGIKIAVPARGNSTISSTTALSVEDPRMNYLPAAWTPRASTPNAQNASVTTIGPYGREGLDMYVRNGPMATPAEIGYLSMGSNWYTYPLASQAGRALLAKFRADTNFVAKSYTNGFVNPNTLNTNVLVAAFAGAPIQRYPDETTPTYGTVDPNSQAGPIAASIASISADDTKTGTNTFDSGAAWVVAPILSSTNGPVGLLDNNQKESIIRNTYRLFNPNQNLFTIVLIAQTINDVNKNGTYDPAVDEITGEKRIVAVVWRDPFPNPAQPTRHESFVRLFRYIDE